MSETRAPYVPAAIINPEDLRDALACLLRARREALLFELAQIERQLGVSPSTSELRREHRGGQPKADQLVRIRE